MNKKFPLVILPVLFLLLFFFLSRNSIVKTPVLSDSIVSLSPSITRQLIDLEVEDRLVGVTSYHPPLKKTVEIVGSIVRPNFEKILVLQPSVVLVSKEDSVTQNTERLSGGGLKIFEFSRNKDFKSICDNFVKLGGVIGKEELALHKISNYSEILRKKSLNKKDSGKKIIFLVSSSPLISVSGGSYISSIIKDAGGRNIFASLDNPYPKISFESLVYSDVEVVIIMCEKITEAENRMKKRIISFRSDMKKRIFFIKPDHIGYYTPSDYIQSVLQIQKILLQI